MNRRKGERPIRHPPDVWSPSHAVAEMIADGDGWLDAWLSQKATPLVRLAKATGISFDRLFALCQGGPVSRAEVDALAGAWAISSADLIASMPDPTLVVD